MNNKNNSNRQPTKRQTVTQKTRTGFITGLLVSALIGSIVSILAMIFLKFNMMTWTLAQTNIAPMVNDLNTIIALLINAAAGMLVASYVYLLYKAYQHEAKEPKWIAAASVVALGCIIPSLITGSNLASLILNQADILNTASNWLNGHVAAALVINIAAGVVITGLIALAAVHGTHYLQHRAKKGANNQNTLRMKTKVINNSGGTNPSSSTSFTYMTEQQGVKQDKNEDKDKNKNENEETTPKIQQCQII